MMNEKGGSNVYPNITIDELVQQKEAREEERFIKQTLLHSPIFTNIIPDFQIAVNKPYKGVRSTSLNDDVDQFVWPKEEDSQLGVFSDDDDDLLFNIGDTHLDGVSHDTREYETENSKLVSVKLIVKLQSLLVDEMEYHLNSAVRSSCVVRGIRNGEEKQEDSLFISLKSGFLLLVRFFNVPRNQNKAALGTMNRYSSRSVFKPYIMQWWDAGSTLSAPLLDTCGYQTYSHSSGLSCVATSASDVFRIFTSKHTKEGLIFNSHHNVPVDGLILLACFGESLEDNLINNHVIFLALVFTNYKRLEIILYNWTITDNLTHNLKKTILPLNNNFKIPIFIVPIRNGNFLFVAEDELTIISMHDIISASYIFRRAQFNGGFPTNYYKPQTRISDYSAGNTITDEVLISTSTGVVYSVLVTDEEISVRPIIRISDPISVFSLERGSSGYKIIFGSDSGSNRELLVGKLYSDEYVNSLSDTQKIDYSSAHLVKDFKNWSPLLDFKVLEGAHRNDECEMNESEMWGLSGGGKRTRLTQFKTGYKAKKLTPGIERLRRATAVFSFKCDNNSYVICSLPFASVLLEYKEIANDFVEISPDNFVYNEPTIFAKNLIDLDSNLVVQVTPKRFVVTDMENSVVMSVNDQSAIVLCDAEINVLAMVIENRQETMPKMEIRLHSLDSDIDSVANFQDIQDGNIISIKQVLEVSYQPSLLKFIRFAGQLLLVIGSYDGFLRFYECSENSLSLINTQSLNESLSTYGDHTQGGVIPNDIESINGEIFLGTREGYLFRFKIQSDNKFSVSHFTVLDNSPLKFIKVTEEEDCLFIHCKYLWLINFCEYNFPSRVHFEEKYERAIYALAPVQLTPEMELERYNLPFVFIRENGFAAGEINTYKSSVIKQTNIGIPAKSFLFIKFISSFLVFCVSKTNGSIMRFMDKKSLKTISHSESTLRNADTPIFEENEVVTSSCIWSIKRHDRISKKLLIGTSTQAEKGLFKVLDVSRVPLTNDNSPTLKVVELTSFEHKQPITNIQQIKTSILFSSGKSIYATSYDSEERKLKPISNLITLPSDVTDILIQDDSILLVTTRLDSIFQFRYSDDAMEQDAEILQLLSYDPSCKSLVNQAIIDNKIIAGEKLQYVIQVMESKSKNMVNQLSLRVSCISRVFKLTLSNRASISGLESDSDHSVVSAGINGEILLLRLSYSTSSELRSLQDSINSRKSFIYSPESFSNKLEAPFTDKLNGKGLIPLNNPYLDYKENKSNRAIMIDYDIDEFARYCNSYYITQ